MSSIGIDAKKAEWLEEVLGEELAAKIIRDLLGKTRALEGAGIRYKAQGEKAAPSPVAPYIADLGQPATPAAKQVRATGDLVAAVKAQAGASVFEPDPYVRNRRAAAPYALTALVGPVVQG